ncbi:hypothetical protein SAY87_020296 [Trapa incisa]|uniref:Uncharacterized protein n=1 Tax=Trapa incisa TaxID=236973 RepID=A0AAN7K9M7_9MYRT|nr:hypothetical protein SAY87_020296 [Trapa incisa]
MEKSKSFGGRSITYSEIRFGLEERAKSYNFNGPNNSSSRNPEIKRQQRVASYNKYATEGKLKSSLRHSFKWIKSKFSYNFCDI